MSRRLTFDDLWRIPHAYDPRLAPDGSAVAFEVRVPERSTDGYTRRIWMAEVSSGRSRAFTAGPRDGSPRWSPDGSRLAFVSTRGDDPRPQLWLIRSDGGEPARLTNLPGGVVGDLTWSPLGDRIAFLAQVGDVPAPGTPVPVVVDSVPYKQDGVGFLPAGHGVAVFVVTVVDGQVRQVTDGRGSAMSPAWSPDGSRLAYGWRRPGNVAVAPAYVVDAGGGEPVRVTWDDLFHSQVLWSPDGATLVTVAADQRVLGPRGLYSVPVGGGTSRDLLPGFDLGVAVGRAGPGAPYGPAFIPGGRLVFAACDRSRDHLFVAVPGGRPRKVVGGDDRLIKGFSATATGLAYVAATPASTGEICVAGLDGSDERCLTTVFADALPGVGVIAPESRTFTAPDGTALHGWLLRGDTGDPAPLLLDIHGGPHDSWPPAFEGPELYQQVLAANGWHVLKLNMRGSDGYGPAFWTALAGQWGSADEGDYHAALDTLVDEGVADPARLAVGGYSYGGFAACWLTTRTDRFAAAVAGGMICNLVSLSGSSDLGILAARVAAGADPHYDHLELLAQRSPLARVRRVRTPTLILQGEAEQRAPLEQAEQWFAALHARGVAVRLVVYPGGAHGVIDDGPPSHRIDFHRRYVQWLRQHAGGRPSGTGPADARPRAPKVAGDFHPAADAADRERRASSLHAQADPAFPSRPV